MLALSAFERATGTRGYGGSPAEREDRQMGIKLGGRVHWLVTPSDLVGTITRVEIDEHGDPWFHLAFEGDHKDVRVERCEIAPLDASRVTHKIVLHTDFQDYYDYCFCGSRSPALTPRFAASAAGAWHVPRCSAIWKTKWGLPCPGMVP